MVLSSPQLFQAKLRGLVRSLTDGDELADSLELHDAPGAAGGIVASGLHMGRAFLLVSDTDPERAIGPSLMWADRRGVAGLDLLVESDFAADLARRASLFSFPITVWSINETSLDPATPRAAATPPELGEDELAFASLIADAGARPVDDHGRLVGELAGLEVARVTVAEDGTAELEVGVGQADRELQMLVHGKLARPEALERAIALVEEHRRIGAPMHPLNRLARERWLRSVILDAPGQLDLVSAEALAPLRPRSTLLGTVPSAALGEDAAGRPVVVVCSVGIDVDLVPEAADYRLRDAPEATLLVVVPARDIHPAIGKQVSLVADAQLVSIPPPWEAPASE